jgi:hypothetical protein
VSQAGAPAQAVTASAPGRLELSGEGDGPRLSVALDRRASCRVEAIPGGVEIESKESLTKASARDVSELLERSPRSLAAQALALLGAASGVRVVTEWKVPAGSGIEGGAALALATTAAVSRALGREDQATELVALAREVAERAGRTDEHGLHAALFGGVVLTRGRAGALEAERPAIDPGRIDESLLVVDAGAPEAAGGGQASPPGPSASRTGPIVEALRSGRYEDVVDLLAEDLGAGDVGPGQRRVVELVRGAGGAARLLGTGRLVAIWAPPGSRGPGRREAVEAALKAAGLKPLAIRVDMRGLELD